MRFRYSVCKFLSVGLLAFNAVAYFAVCSRAEAQQVTSRNADENGAKKDLKVLELLTPILSKSEKREIREIQKRFLDRKAERTRYGIALLSYNGDESFDVDAALRVGIDAISREPKPSVEFVVRW